MFSSRAKRAEIKQILMGLAALGGAFVGIANLICAVAYGAVFLTRGSSDWTTLDAAPFRFFFSVAASLIATPFLALMGVLAIKGARDERRFLESAPYRPHYEEPTHTSGFQP